MILTVMALFAGVLFSTITAVLYHQERTRVMRRDVVAALSAQADDSYRSGYMRGLLDEKIRLKKLAKDSETYEKSLV